MRTTPSGKTARLLTPFALFTLAPVPALALDAAQMLAKVTPSVFVVSAFNAQRAPLAAGSAVVTGPGQLVTACHVLAGARTVTIQRDNVSYGATLEAPDVERDICLLKVANFNAPAVAIAAGAPAFGQRVFTAIATDEGRVAMSQGAVAGLRAGPDGSLDRIQASVAPAAGMSGGGLFDDSGRLVGVLTRAAQGDAMTSALPSAWIATAHGRSASALANYKPAPVAIAAATASPVATAGATPGATPGSAAGESPRVGETWRYELTDRLTKLKREVVYRVDRIDGDKVIFNQGARVETRDGRLQKLTSPIGGEFDGVSPPNGWVPADLRVGMSWKYSYKAPTGDARTELAGRVTSESAFRLGNDEVRAFRISYDGTVQRSFYGAGANGNLVSVPYRISVWYAPELKRVVRFDATYAHRYDRVDESLVLVEHRFD